MRWESPRASRPSRSSYIQRLAASRIFNVRAGAYCVIHPLPPISKRRGVALPRAKPSHFLLTIDYSMARHVCICISSGIAYPDASGASVLMSIPSIILADRPPSLFTRQPRLDTRELYHRILWSPVLRHTSATILYKVVEMCKELYRCLMQHRIHMFRFPTNFDCRH